MSILDKLNKKKVDTNSVILSDPNPSTKLAYEEITEFTRVNFGYVWAKMQVYIDSLVKAKLKKKGNKNRYEINYLFNDKRITYWFSQYDGFDLDKNIAVGLALEYYNNALSKEEDKLWKFNKKDHNWYKTYNDGKIHWDNISLLKRNAAKKAVRNFNINYKKILNKKNIDIGLSIVCATKNFEGKMYDLGRMFSGNKPFNQAKIENDMEDFKLESYVLEKASLHWKHPELVKILDKTKITYKEHIKPNSINNLEKNLEEMTEILATKYLNIL